MATYYRSGSEWVPSEAATFDAAFLGNGATIYLSGTSSSPSTVNNLSGTLNANPPSSSDSFGSDSGWANASIYQHGYWSQHWNGTSYYNQWNWQYYNSFLGPYSNGSSSADQDTWKNFNFDGLPVTISFDLHRFGSWDNETFTAFVNDTPVFQVSSGHSGWLGGAGSTYSGSTNGYNWTLVSQDSFENRIFTEYGDQTARVTFSLPSNFFASNTNLKLGFGANLDEAPDNESFGIDNLSITTLPVFTSPLTVNTVDSNSNSINVITGTNNTTINASASGDVVTVNAGAMSDNTTLDLNGSNTFNVNSIGANTNAADATGAVNLSYGWASDGSASITTGTGATSISGSSATLVVDAALQAENASITLSGGANQVVNNLVADISATSLSGTLTVNAADAGDGGITITTGTNSTTISASGSGDTITVKANAMQDNTWLDLNGSATFNASNLIANTDASGSSSIVTLSYSDIADGGASITLGTGASTVSGSTGGDTLTINAASQPESASITLTGNANQVVNNLVANVDATALSGALTVSTGNASDDGITITSGTGNTTVSASGSNDTVTVEADLMLDNTTLDLNGSASFSVNKIEANTDAAGSSGSVTLSYAAVSDGTATITTGTGPISLTSSTSGNTLNVNAASLNQNTTLTQSGAANQVVTNLVGNIDASALTGKLTVTTGNAGDGGISITTGNGITSVSGGSSDDTVTINAASQPESATLTLSGVAQQVVNNLVADISATSLSGSLTVNAGDAGDGGITITTGTNSTTISASGSGDTITVKANAMQDNTWLDLNGSATFDASNLIANTDASGSSSIVTLAYSAIPDGGASITLGTGASTVSGSTTTNTLTINAASQLESASITLTGNANQVVNNLVANVDATALSGALTVNTGNASDDGITITSGTGNTTVSASGSNDTVTVEADLMLNNTTLDLNGSASFSVNKIEANTDAAGSSGSVTLSYAATSDGSATITTGTGAISVTSSTSGDNLTVNAASLKQNTTLTQSGAANQVVTNLVGDINATALTGSLTVTSGDAGDNGISISTGKNNTTITASGSNDVITVDADVLDDNKTLDLNGSATFNVNKLEANTDASGSSGTVTLAYTAVTDQNATITIGSGATTVSGTTSGDTLTVNAASLAQNSSLTQSGAADQVVTNLVGDINATALTGSLTVTTGDAGDNGISITTGNNDTTITANGSGDLISVNAAKLDDNTVLDLNGSARFNATNLQADVNGAGSSGSVSLSYTNISGNDASVSTGSGVTTLFTTGGDDTFTVDATKLANNTSLFLSGPSAVSVTGITGNLDANAQISYSDGFASASDWTGGSLDTTPYYSSFLGRYASDSAQTNGQNVYTSYTLNNIASTLTFQVNRIDSWDGEAFTAYINDTPAFQANFGQYAISSQSGSTNGFSWTMTPIDSYTNRGFASYQDQSATVTINIPAGYETIKLGFGSTLDQLSNDESYGIDNLSITGSLGAATGPLTIATGNNIDDNTISINLGTGNTTLTGGDSSDTITVTAMNTKNQVFSASASTANVSVVAGANSQTITGSSTGNDTIDGGSDLDTLSYAGGVSDPNVDVTVTSYTTLSGTSTGQGNDQFTNIETLVGGNGTDILRGINSSAQQILTITGDTSGTLTNSSGAGFTFSDFESFFLGSGSSDTLIDNTGDSTVLITGANSGSIDQLAFGAIENLTLSTGVDEVTVSSGGSLSGTIDLGEGATNKVDMDSGAGAIGAITSAGGDDSFTINGGSVTGAVTAGNGINILSINDTSSSIGSYTGGTGVDTITSKGGDVNGAISTGSAADSVTLSDGAKVSGAVTLGSNNDSSDGNDLLSLDASTVAGAVNTGSGADSVSVLNASTISNSVTLGSNTDSSDGADTLIVTGASSSSKSVITGSVTTGAGADLVNLTDAKIDSTGTAFSLGTDSNSLDGNDSLIGSGAEILGTISTGAGSDVVDLSNASSVSGDVSLGTGTDTVGGNADLLKLDDSSIKGNVDMGAGIDTIRADNGSSITGNIDTGTGVDLLTLDNASSISGVVTMGDGNDTLTADHASLIKGDVNMGIGLDQVNVLGASTITGNVLLGGNSDSSTDVDTFTVTGASSTDQSVIIGSVTTGSGADLVNLTDAKIDSTGTAFSLGTDSNSLDGNDSLVGSGAEITGKITTGAGSDVVDLSKGSSVSGDVTLGTGTDTVGGNADLLKLDASSILGNVAMGAGLDSVSIKNASTITGDVTLGANTDSTSDVDTLTLTGASSADKSVITGTVTTGSGADLVTLTDAKIESTGTAISLGTDSNSLDGNDSLVGSGAEITGKIITGAGSDVVNLSKGSSVSGDVTLGTGTDTIGGNADLLKLDASSIKGNVDMGAGIDTISADNGSSITGNIDTGTGVDLLTIDNASTITGVVTMGDGNDTLTADHASLIKGDVNMGIGLDQVNVLGASTITGNVLLGGTSDSLTDVDTLTVTGASSTDQSVIIGSVTTGSGADLVNLTDAKIESTGTAFSLGTDGSNLDGNDSLVGSGAEITGKITTGAGSDVVDLSTGSSVIGDVTLGTGTDAVGGNADLLKLDASSIKGNVDMGAGVDTVSADNGSSITGNIDTGSGVDLLTLDNSSSITGIVTMGDGNDTLTADHASLIKGDVNMGIGLDQVNVLGASTITGNVLLGGNSDSSTDVDTLTVTGASSTDQSVIIGSVTTGSGDDYVKLTDAKIDSTGTAFSLGSDSNSLDGDDSLVGSGAEITGKITTGSGSDVVDLSKGSSVIGDVVLGSGTDTVGGNADLLKLDASSIKGNVDMAAGLDTLSVLNGSSITGDVNLGANTDSKTDVDTLTVTGASSTDKSLIIGSVTTGSGADYVNLTDAKIESTDTALSLGTHGNSFDGNDSLVGSGAEITGKIITGAGSDVIDLSQGSAVVGDVYLGIDADTIGGNTDTLTLDDSSITGNVFTGAGADTASILNGSSLDGDLTLGADTDSKDYADRLIVTGASNTAQSSITGSVTTGAGADWVTLTNAKVGSSGDTLSLGVVGNALDGDDTLEGIGAEITADITTGAGSDTINLTDSSAVEGNLTLGSNTDVLDDSDYLTLTSSAGIVGNVALGYADDTLNFGAGIKDSATITGDVAFGVGTWDTISYKNNEGPINVAINKNSNGTATESFAKYVTGVVSDFEFIIGSDYSSPTSDTVEGDTIYDNTGGSLVILTGPNSGTINDIDFISIENLQLRSGDDTLSFRGPSNAPGLIYGRADGGGIEGADYIMGEYVGGEYEDTGIDLLDYTQYLAGPATVNLSLNQATGVFSDKAGGLISGDGSIATQTEDSSFENVDGSKFSDMITGDNQSEQGNVIRGMAGDDTIDGLAGDDTIDGGDSTAGPDGNDVIAGGDGADLIIASNGSDFISGGAITGTPGNYTAEDDGSVDTLTYIDENEGVEVVLTGVDQGYVNADAASSFPTPEEFVNHYTKSGDAQTVWVSKAETNQTDTDWKDTFGDIQRLVLTDRSDILRIDSDEYLTTSTPSGPDDGTYGVDAAGGDFDTLDYSTFSKDNPVYVNLSDDIYSFDLDANGEIDPTAGEVMFYNPLSATNISADPVSPTSNTTLEIPGDGGSNGSGGIAMSPSSFGGSYGVNNFEVVISGAADDAIVGNDADNILAGNDGSDRLAGGAGNDTIFGGRGDDYIVPGEGADKVYGGEGINTIVITSTDLQQDKFFIEQGGINIYKLNGQGGANADTSQIDAPSGTWDPGESGIDLIDGGDPTPDPSGNGEFIYDTINGTSSPDYYNFSGTAFKNVSDVKLGGGDDGVSTAPTSKGVRVTYDGESGDDDITLSFTFDQFAALNQSGLYVADVQNYVDDPSGKTFASNQADFSATNFERGGVSVISPKLFNSLQGDPEAITSNISIGLQKTAVTSGSDLSLAATTNTTSTAKADSVYDIVGALVQANQVKGVDQVTVSSGAALSGVASADQKASASAITIDDRSNVVMGAYALGMDRSSLEAGTDVSFNLAGNVVADSVGQVGTVVAKVNGTAESAGSRDSSISAGDALSLTISGSTNQSVSGTATAGISLAGASSRTYGIDDANITNSTADSVQAGSDVVLSANATGNTRVSSSGINSSFVAPIRLDDRGVASFDRFVTTLVGASAFPFINGDRLRFTNTAPGGSVEAGRDYFVYNVIQGLGEFQLSSTPNGDPVDVLVGDDNFIIDVVRPAISTADAISTVTGVQLTLASSGVQAGTGLTLNSSAVDDVRATALSVEGEATAGLNRLGSLDGMNTSLFSRVASLSDTSSQAGTTAQLQLTARDGVLVQATSTASDALSEANSQVSAAAASPTTAGSSLTLQAGAQLNQVVTATSTAGMADSRSGSGAGAGSSTDSKGTGVPLADSYSLANAVADSDQTAGTNLSISAAGSVNLAANASTVGGVSELRSVYSDGNNVLSTFDPAATASLNTPSMIGPHYLAEGQRVQLDSASATQLGLPTDNADYVVRLLTMGAISASGDTLTMPDGITYINGDAIRFRLNTNAAIGTDEKRYGVTLGKTYYVKNASGTTFQLAESPGIAAGVIDLSDDLTGSPDQLVDADRFQLLEPPANPGDPYTVATLTGGQSGLTVLVPSEANAFAGSRQANITLANPATLDLAEVKGIARSSLVSGTDATISALSDGVLNAISRNTGDDATAAAGVTAVGLSDSGIQSGSTATILADARSQSVAEATTTGDQSVNDNSLSSVNLSARGIEAAAAADSIEVGSSGTITSNASLDTRSTATIVNGSADALASMESTGVRASDATFSITIGDVGDLISTARVGSALNPVLVSAVSSGAGNATAQGASLVEGILGTYDSTTTSFSVVQPGAAQADLNSQGSANIQLQATATSGIATATLSDAAGTGAAIVSGIRDMSINLGSGLSTLSSNASGNYEVEARSVNDIANVSASTIAQGLLSGNATTLPVSFSNKGSIAALVNNVTISRAISVAGDSNSGLDANSIGMGNVNLTTGGSSEVMISSMGRANNQSQSVLGTS